MKKHFIVAFLSILFLTCFNQSLVAQLYLLNEDFSSGTGTKPPSGWNSITVTGPATDLWRFDNPGNRQVNFPIIGTFAIFDSETYSGGGGAEKVSLETPFVDCSFSPYIILYFDHVFASRRNGKAEVEVFDGTKWSIVKTYLDSIPTAVTESIDVSALLGNKTGAKVRFTWNGDSSQYWIVDNVKLYAPLSRDARLKALDNPKVPVIAGANPVRVTLANEGYQTITSAVIRWSANGVRQADYNWTGSIVRDSAQSNIPLGNYNFPAGSLTQLKIWVDNPNGSADLNKLNDTLNVNIRTALCGVYTIGGANPDFATFNDAVTALHLAGVSCPVVFKVRDGVYEEQVKIFAIPGTNSTNTVTFESESGDSSRAEIHYKLNNIASDYTVNFSGSSNIIFNKIGILRSVGSYSIFSDDSTKNILIKNCRLNDISLFNSKNISFENNNLSSMVFRWGLAATRVINLRIINNTFTSHHGIRVYGPDSDSVFVKGNKINWLSNPWDGYGMSFEGGIKDVLEVDNNIIRNFISHGIYVNNPVGGKSKIRGNSIDSIRLQGIVVDGRGGEYTGNRVAHMLAGIGIVVNAEGSLVANNYIHAIGSGFSKGIRLQPNGRTSKILFNNVNVVGSDVVNGRALEVEGGDGYVIKNNIFANNGGGYAAYHISDISTFDISHNNYYSSKSRIGFYNGKTYDTLSTFAAATGKDVQSMNINPYYVSDTSLVPTHALLDGAAVVMPEVNTDIVGIIRTNTPDIGAKEFDLCANDAGINGFSGIGNPAPVGSVPVRVVLQNNGSSALTSTAISWSVNGTLQTPFNWTGNLASKQSVVVTLGNYAFSSGRLFTMRAWTTGANGGSDCKQANDSCSALGLGTQLCGVYTIGGVNPDFATFNDAVATLHTAGVSCPVVFKVRNGVYEEQVKIFAIPGASAINTVTFESESGDSSKVELHYKQINFQTNDYTLKFSGASHVIFKKISILRSNAVIGILGEDQSSAIVIENGTLSSIMINQVEGLTLKNNYIFVPHAWYWSINITSSKNIILNRNIINSHRGIRVYGPGSDSVFVKGNKLTWLPGQYDGLGMSFEGGIKEILEVDSNILRNYIHHGIYVNNPVGGKSKVRWNWVDSARSQGIVTDGSGGEYTGNRITDLVSGAGIVVNGQGSLVANNYIHASGSGVSKGIRLLKNGRTSKILFNNVNVVGSDVVNGRALEVEGGDGYVIKNNIFANNGGGYAVYHISDISTLDISHNNYYSSKSRIGFYNGKTYDTLSTFAAATGKDVQSMNINPYYVSDTSLVPTHALLDGAAVAIPEVSGDISGVIRSASPDIGAKEFDLCPNDAGVNSFWGISNPAPVGSAPVRVVLQNNGSSALTSATIGWSVNGTAQTPFVWSGNLASKQSVVVTLANYTYTAGGLFKLRAWTTGANGGSDCKQANDTCDVLELGTQLCGVYTIGGVNPDFATFNDAVAALHTAGVVCPVVFKVRDGVYEEQVKIFAIPGASAINTVTFESESGDSSKVELVYKKTNVIDDYTLKFSGSSHVTFRKMSILRMAETFSLVIDELSSSISLENNSMNSRINIQNSRQIQFKNNRIISLPGWTLQIAGSYNIHIRGNYLRSQYGIRVHGSECDSIYIKNNDLAFLDPNWGDGSGMHFEGVVKSLVEVDSNLVSGFINSGIYVNTPSSSIAKMRWNRIENIRDVGIYSEGAGNIEIANTRILGIKIGTGIVARGPNSLIYNNYIQTVGSGISKGIVLHPSANGSKLLFNSINVNGTDVSNGRALEVSGGEGYVIKNNIFANNGGGVAAYYMNVPPTKDIDYNNYFSTGNNFANLNGQLFNNLTQWGVAINGDANSKNLNPNYKSDTALLPFQKQFNGAGISSGNILLDIDGEIRNQQAPDIGAQEFMVDFGVTRLVSPTNECKHSVTTPVTVYLRQFGDIPFIDLKLAYQINGGPIFYDTIPGSISNDLEYTFNKPQDLSLNGTYIFKIWLVDNGDDNLNNDTLVVTRKNKDAPVVDFSYISQCSGLAVPFTGTATIASGFIDRVEWEFGDSTLGVGYTPSHIYDTSGAYTVTMRAFSDQGCYSEVKKVINLKPTPLANFTAKDVCFGVPLKPINTTTIQPGATITGYNWNFGDGSTSTLKDPTHQYSQADTFNVKLVVTANNGCIDSITKPVISYAFENSAYKFRKPLQNYICEGASLKLAASGAISYQWLFNGQPIDGAKDSIYLATKAGKYAVIFVNPLGCRSSASDSVVLKVVKKPEAKFTYDSYCVGTPIQFKETSERDTTVAYTFTWDFGDNSPKVLGSTQTHTYSKSGEYKAFMYLSSTACANHADTTYENIKVETPLKGKRYEDVAVLQGKSKKLEARDFGVKYLWTPATQLDNPNIKEPTVKAEKEQLYQVSITSKSGCVTVDTVKVVLFDKCDIKAPEGFSPNDDGNNDRFYPFKIGIKTMKLFRIYDRFGNLVYDNKNATNADGWDGKKDGKKLPVGVYVWVAEGTGEDDQPIKRSGNVILVK